MTYRPRRLLLCLVALAVTQTAAHSYGLTLEDLALEPPSGCKTVGGEHPVSLQASMQYSAPSPKPERKTFQSFHCSNHDSTVYFFQYSADTDMKLAVLLAGALVCGGPCPTSEHPERILTVENILVVISSPKPKTFESAITQKASRAREATK